MRKKSFRENNPALQFITPAINTDNTQDTDNTHNTLNTDNTTNTHHTSADSSIPAAKTQKETKSKRLNLLIQPSLYEELTKIAYVQRVSLNELILQAAREYAATNQDAVEKYNEFTGAFK